MIARVRMDGQRRIRIPKKAALEGDTFLLLSLGAYHILFPVPSEKPELDLQGSIAELLEQGEAEATKDVSKRWGRKSRSVD
jgi:hypothetical protein